MPRSKTLPEPEEWKFKEPGEDLEYDTWFKEQVQIGLDQLARGGDCLRRDRSRKMAASAR